MAKRNFKVVQASAPAPRIVKTREEKALGLLEFIQAGANKMVVDSQNELNVFTEKLTSDPSYAFEWSYSAFQAAAKNKTAKDILALIDRGLKSMVDEYVATSSPEKVIRYVRAYLYGEVLRGAKWPERSTSVQSNQMKTELTAQRGEWLETFDRYIERIETEG